MMLLHRHRQVSVSGTGLRHRGDKQMRGGHDIPTWYSHMEETAI